jgi:hypothetical protein
MHISLISICPHTWSPLVVTLVVIPLRVAAIPLEVTLEVILLRISRGEGRKAEKEQDGDSESAIPILFFC